MRSITIGTRGSDLALWQANHVKGILEQGGISTTIKIIKTQGDRILNLRLDKLEGKGFFTKELEDELLAGKIDLAVHSYKDLPTVNAAGLTIAATLDREDANEYLLIHPKGRDARQKFGLKTGAVVGTSSNRRKAQLLALRPDVKVSDLRGNVPTRIGKLEEGKYDAILLAKAGVERLKLNLENLDVYEFTTREFIPAPAQGALALQVRENDEELNIALQKLNNYDAAVCVELERKVLNLFEGGCHMPLGCYCELENGLYNAYACKADDANAFPVRFYVKEAAISGLAEKMVACLDKKVAGKSVFITRELGEQSYISRAFNALGVNVDARPLIKTFATLRRLDPSVTARVNWIFFNSRNAIRYFFELQPGLPETVKYAAVGPATAEELKKYSLTAEYVGDGVNMEMIAAQMSELCGGQTVLFPRSTESLKSVQKNLGGDVTIIDLPVYETVLEEDVAGSGGDVLVFTSPSNATAYFTYNLPYPEQAVIAIGGSTAAKLAEFGIKCCTPEGPDEVSLFETIFAEL